LESEKGNKCFPSALQICIFLCSPDVLGDIHDFNCGAFVLSSMATEIEKQNIQWMGELIGYPAGDGIM
jgi:hypothetical protein